MAGRRPLWANWKAQDKDGQRCYFEWKPKIHYVRWVTGGRVKTYMESEPNENWENTLIRI